MARTCVRRRIRPSSLTLPASCGKHAALPAAGAPQAKASLLENCARSCRVFGDPPKARLFFRESRIPAPGNSDHPNGHDLFVTRPPHGKRHVQENSIPAKAPASQARARSRNIPLSACGHSLASPFREGPSPSPPMKKFSHHARFFHKKQPEESPTFHGTQGFLRDVKKIRRVLSHCLTFLKAAYIRISRYRVISKAGMTWNTSSNFLTSACAGAKHQSHRSFFMPEQCWQKARATSAGFFIFVHRFPSDVILHPPASDRPNRNTTRSYDSKKDTE